MEKEELLVPEGEWTAAEQVALRKKLLPLLAHRTALYAAGDTSVRVETVRELLASITFTLDVGLMGASRRTLLTADLDALFERGGHVIDQKVEAGRLLWNAACLTAPKLESRSLQETLQNFSLFWKRYDARFFAHVFPCDIDYPLLCTVPEMLLGVEYMNEYLHRILTENAMLAAFDPVLTTRFLDADSPFWRDAPANLVAPVFANAVGRAILMKKDLRVLTLSADDLAVLSARFAVLADEKVTETLQLAAETVCNMANIRDAASRTYLADAASALLPRLRRVPAEGWRGIFPTLE